MVGRRLNSLEMREHRKTPRYPLGVPGKLHLARGSPGRKVVIRLISTQGCALESPEGPTAGKRCELYFEWQDVLIGVEAQVVWKDAQGRMGLKFLSVDKDTQQRLSALCTSLRDLPREAPPREDPGLSRAPVAPTQPREKARPAASPPAAASPAPPPARPAGQRERRRVPRYVSELPTRISHPATGADWNVTLVTLSILGGCAEGSDLPQPGEQYELTTEWEGQSLCIEAAVVWKAKERIGFEFVRLRPEAERLLREICANLRLQPLAPLPPEPS